MTPLSQLDASLRAALADSGPLAYLLIAGLALSQTGLLIGPAVPGNTLLFVAGVIVRSSESNSLIGLVATGAIAAAAGNLLNYGLGRWVGPKVKWKEKGLVSRANLERTNTFFDQHGSLAILIAPFVPIVRSFAPFVAGMAGMKSSQFTVWSLIGPPLWVMITMGAGYFAGNVPWVRDNITLFAGGLFLIVTTKIVWTLIKQKRKSVQPAQP